MIKKLIKSLFLVVAMIPSFSGAMDAGQLLQQRRILDNPAVRRLLVYGVGYVALTKVLPVVAFQVIYRGMLARQHILDYTFEKAFDSVHYAYSAEQINNVDNKDPDYQVFIEDLSKLLKSPGITTNIELMWRYRSAAKQYQQAINTVVKPLCRFAPVETECQICSSHKEVLKQSPCSTCPVPTIEFPEGTKICLQCVQYGLDHYAKVKNDKLSLLCVVCRNPISWATVIKNLRCTVPFP